MSIRRLSLLLAAPAALSACAAGPDYRPAAPAELGVPDRYSVAADQDRREDLGRWWERFNDPLLQQLVAETATTNLDVAQAVVRIRQARESLIQSRATLLPTLSGSAGYSRNFNLRGGSAAVTLPDGTVTNISRGAGDSFSLGADASYQADIFGGVRRTIEATRASEEASRFDYATVLIAQQAEIARNYVSARLAQAQLANARSSLALQDDNLEIAGFRVQAGLVSSLDQETARAQRAQTAATIPTIEASYNSAVSRLAVLTGRAPGALKDSMAATRPIPIAATPIGVGIPADTLRQRPDVLAAERSLAAATAQIGVARAQLYPALAISGSIDTNATSFSNLADVISGGLFAGLTQAIFNGGRLRSQVRSQEAAAEGALLTYRSTVLTALEDVENAVVALDAAQRRAREFAVALDASRNSAILSRSQYRAGLTDFTTLNQAEASLLSAGNGLAQAQADQASALVQLFTALGGGWDAAAIPSGDTRAAPRITGSFPAVAPTDQTPQDR